MPEADLAYLTAALHPALPAGGLGADPAAFAVDGVVPALVATATKPEDVATVLKAADEAGAAVIPWGAGTHMGLGMPPARYDLALDLRRLNQLIEYEPADLTVTVEAGMRLDSLQKALGANGQWLPLDPPSANATIGGILASNASGPTRYRYGTARDQLIGISFALPSGALVKSGGRVVKNVAGYDLGKLQIGALGTLGVITQATFKVAPLPVKTELAVLASDSLTSLTLITSRITDVLLSVYALEITRDAGATLWRLRIQFAGGAAAVARSQSDLTAFASEAGAEIAQESLSGTRRAGPEIVLRASVRPTDLQAVCEAMAAAGGSVLAYPTAGIVRGSWQEASALDAATIISMRMKLSGNAGALVLEKAPAELKQTAGVWGEPRGDFELMRRVKDELDPNSTLNPGRFLGGI